MILINSKKFLQFSCCDCKVNSDHRFSKQKDLSGFNIKGFGKIAIHFMPHNIF